MPTSLTSRSISLMLPMVSRILVTVMALLAAEYETIAEVKSVLLARPDAADPAVVQIIAECDEYLACGT